MGEVYIVHTLWNFIVDIRVRVTVPSGVRIPAWRRSGSVWCSAKSQDPRKFETRFNPTFNTVWLESSDYSWGVSVYSQRDLNFLGEVVSDLSIDLFLRVTRCDYTGLFCSNSKHRYLPTLFTKIGRFSYYCVRSYKVKQISIDCTISEVVELVHIETAGGVLSTLETYRRFRWKIESICLW